MTTPSTDRNFSRLIALGAVVVVIAVPIALITATWQPLEPEPRPNRASLKVEQGPEGGTPSPESGDADNPNQGNETTPAPAVEATPRVSRLAPASNASMPS